MTGTGCMRSVSSGWRYCSSGTGLRPRTSCRTRSWDCTGPGTGSTTLAMALDICAPPSSTAAAPRSGAGSAPGCSGCSMIRRSGQQKRQRWTARTGGRCSPRSPGCRAASARCSRSVTTWASAKGNRRLTPHQPGNRVVHGIPRAGRARPRNRGGTVNDLELRLSDAYREAAGTVRPEELRSLQIEQPARQRSTADSRRRRSLTPLIAAAAVLAVVVAAAVAGPRVLSGRQDRHHAVSSGHVTRKGHGAGIEGSLPGLRRCQ